MLQGWLSFKCCFTLRRGSLLNITFTSNETDVNLQWILTFSIYLYLVHSLYLISPYFSYKTNYLNFINQWKRIKNTPTNLLIISSRGGSLTGNSGGSDWVLAWIPYRGGNVSVSELFWY